MHRTASTNVFLEEVMAAAPGGESLRECLQCGTCGGSCPSGPDMDNTPRQLFAMINAGMRDEVLRSNTPLVLRLLLLLHHPLPQRNPHHRHHVCAQAHGGARQAV